MRRLLLLLIGPLAATSHAQVTLDWAAASGARPEQMVPQWQVLLGASSSTVGCNGATAVLAPTQLVVDTSACAGDYGSYNHWFSGIAGPAKLPTLYWVEARARVVSSLQADPARGVGQVWLEIVNTCGWALELDDDWIGLRYYDQLLASATVDTTLAAHDFRVDVEAATQTANVFVDGQHVLTAQGPHTPPCNLPGI